MLPSLCQQIWKTQQWPQDWKRSVFVPIPKKGNAKECSNYHTIALISYPARFCSKSFKLCFSSVWTENFQMYNLDLEKAEEPEWNCQHMLDHRKSKGIPKNVYFCFINYAKTFDCMDHNKLWNILHEMGIPDHIICLLRNLYEGQEATVRTGQGTTDWFKIGKGVPQSCISSSCLFKLYTSCEMPGWMKHNLESRFPGKITIISDMQMILL